MKQFKQLALIFASLLVVAFSFSFTKSFDPSSSIQKKSIGCQFTALADDDVDEDFTDPEFNFSHAYIPLFFNGEQNQNRDFRYASGTPHPSVPFYLKVRNLRI